MPWANASRFWIKSYGRNNLNNNRKTYQKTQEKRIYQYTGFIKFDDYIITIGTPHKFFGENKNDEIINEETASYTTHKFKVKKIENIGTEEEIDNIDFYKKNNVYNMHIEYYINKQVAFDEGFISNKNYLTFKNGYSNIIRTYYKSGQLYEEFFQNSGKIEGVYKIFHENGNLKIESNYIDGKDISSIVYNSKGDILYTI